jgi:hypothetical protein
MKISEIKENLCYKDPLNPMFDDLYAHDDEEPTPRIDCACDNCFYGRDKLAVELLKMKGLDYE